MYQRRRIVQESHWPKMQKAPTMTGRRRLGISMSNGLLQKSPGRMNENTTHAISKVFSRLSKRSAWTKHAILWRPARKEEENSSPLAFVADWCVSWCLRSDLFHTCSLWVLIDVSEVEEVTGITFSSSFSSRRRPVMVAAFWVFGQWLSRMIVRLWYMTS